ncbi:Mth938-like domain-containing protein [Acidithiobacillus sp.]|uniref:Mth938-like domain-containing protein n=1 Tax=Acidithiobacillus sp. TaxID=1872118 RepID=UPI0025BEFDFD|nr:Mth938-like domain-containing protein [Acidithiobacillus sp.]
MKLHRQEDSGQNLIQLYDDAGFVIQGRRHGGGVLVAAHSLESPWGPATAAELVAADFDGIAAMEPEVIVVGTGRSQHLLLPALHELRRLGLALEIMDTGAACRTYNVLLAEDRRVVAALLHPAAH